MDFHCSEGMGLQGLSSDAFDVGCTRCPRLADFLAACRATHPEHFGRPVAPFGDLNAGLLVVGLAPGYNGANRTGRPFTGDFCGDLLYSTLHRHGFASAPHSVSRDDGLQLLNCRVTNAVKCVPPENKPTLAEIKACNTFLSVELTQYRPRVIIALGVIAHEAVLMSLGLKKSAYKFAHGARHVVGVIALHHASASQASAAATQPHQLPYNAAATPITLLDSYHVSRYNTQTGRLTEAMFDAVVADASRLLKTG